MHRIQLNRLSHERSEAENQALQSVYAAVADYCMRIIGHIPTIEEMRPAQLLRPRQLRQVQSSYFPLQVKVTH